MTPAPAPSPIFPTIRFSAFDRMARIGSEPLNAELVDGVWQIPAHVAAEALRVSK